LGGKKLEESGAAGPHCAGEDLYSVHMLCCDQKSVTDKLIIEIVSHLCIMWA